MTEYTWTATTPALRLAFGFCAFVGPLGCSQESGTDPSSADSGSGTASTAFDDLSGATPVDDESTAAGSESESTDPGTDPDTGQAPDTDTDTATDSEADTTSGSDETSSSTGVQIAMCGNAIVEGPHEECDDGQNGDNTDACTDSCLLPTCGDGFVQPAIGEECDDAADTFTCNTACSSKQWGPSVAVENVAGTVLSTHRVAMTPDGRVLVVWAQSPDVSGDQGSLFAAFYDPIAAVWGAPTVLEADSDAIYTMTIAVSDNGDALVVWRPAPTGGVSVNRYDSSAGAWDGASSLTDEQAVADPVVTMDSVGNGFVGWGVSLVSDFIVRRYDEVAGAWSPAVELADTSSAAFSLQADGNGDALALWPTGAGPRYRRFDPVTATWLASQAIPWTGLDQGDVTAATNNGQTVMVSISNGNGPTPSISANRYDFPTSTWGSVSTLASDTVPLLLPSIAAGVDGSAVVTWARQGTTWSLEAARFDPIDGAWQPAVTLDSDMGQLSFGDAAIEGTGHVFVTWSERQDPDNFFDYLSYVTHYEPSAGTWGPPIALDFALLPRVRAPQVAMSPSGTAVITTIQRDNVEFSLFANHYQ